MHCFSLSNGPILVLICSCICLSLLVRLLTPTCSLVNVLQILFCLTVSCIWVFFFTVALYSKCFDITLSKRVEKMETKRTEMFNMFISSGQLWLWAQKPHPLNQSKKVGLKGGETEVTWLVSNNGWPEHLSLTHIRIRISLTWELWKALVESKNKAVEVKLNIIVKLSVICILVLKLAPPFFFCKTTYIWITKLSLILQQSEHAEQKDAKGRSRWYRAIHVNSVSIQLMFI